MFATFGITHCTMSELYRRKHCSCKKANTFDLILDKNSFITNKGYFVSQTSKEELAIIEMTKHHFGGNCEYMGNHHHSDNFQGLA